MITKSVPLVPLSPKISSHTLREHRQSAPTVAHHRAIESARAHTMEQLEPEDVVPQTLVFAQLPGLPWWPAVVGRCPATNFWHDREQRRWTFFFGSRYGAWLNITDMRPYCGDTKESIPEINAFVASYAKYKERVLAACELADEFEETEGKGRPTGEYCRCLTGEAIDMPGLPRWGPEGPPRKPTSMAVAPVRVSVPKKVKSTLRATRRSASVEESQEEGEDGGGDVRRPQRKRRKSVRTKDLEEIEEDRLKTRRKDGSSEDGDADDVEPESPSRKSKGEGSATPTRASKRTTATKNGGSAINVDKDNRLLIRINKAAVSSPDKPSGPGRRKWPKRGRQEDDEGPPPRGPPKGTVWKQRKGPRPAILPPPMNHGQMHLEESRQQASSGFPVRKNPMFRALPPPKAPQVADGDASDATMSEDDMDRIVGFAPNRAAVPTAVAERSMEKWFQRQLSNSPEATEKRPSAQARVLLSAQARVEKMDKKVREMQAMVGVKDGPTESSDPAALNFKNTVEGLLRGAEDFVEQFGCNEAKIKAAVERMMPKDGAEEMGSAPAWAAWKMAVWEAYRQGILSAQSQGSAEQ